MAGNNMGGRDARGTKVKVASGPAVGPGAFVKCIPKGGERGATVWEEARAGAGVLKNSGEGVRPEAVEGVGVDVEREVAGVEIKEWSAEFIAQGNGRRFVKVEDEDVEEDGKGTAKGLNGEGRGVGILGVREGV